jgi:dTDP-4-amino-4,6-dideoxy-D-galactose acyltransferase
MDKRFKTLIWDTKNFGYRVASICCAQLSYFELEGILYELRQKDIKLAYWFVDSKLASCNKVARESGGFLADRKITYSREIPPTGYDDEVNKNIVSYLGKSLNDRLLKLSFEAGRYSRFRRDPRFEKSEFEIIYREWIRKSLSGKLAEEVFVYLRGDIEMGFVTVKSDLSGIAKIDLIAVDKNYRGYGIGNSLVGAAINWSSKKGCKKIVVITQKANKTACKFYEKLGFLKIKEESVYHFWL